MRRAGATALLLVLLGLGYWGYSAYKQRELQGAVVTLVADATARVRDALQVRESGAAELERLDGHLKALGAATQRLSRLDTWRNPQLSDAAQQYVDEAHALLRRQIAVGRARNAVLAGVNALAVHIRAARGRSSDWIGEAIALKQQMDRDFFDYRLAEGGLQKSFQALPNASRQLAPLIAPAPLMENGPFADARSRLSDASAQLARQVEAARKLPLPR